MGELAQGLAILAVAVGATWTLLFLLQRAVLFPAPGPRSGPAGGRGIGAAPLDLGGRPARFVAMPCAHNDCPRPWREVQRFLVEAGVLARAGPSDCP